MGDGRAGVQVPTEKYTSGEPSVMFAAIRTWEDYLNCYHMNHGADILTERLNLLYRPFFLYADHKPSQEESAVALSRTTHDGESQDERARGNRLEQLDETAYNYWYVKDYAIGSS